MAQIMYVFYFLLLSLLMLLLMAAGDGNGNGNNGYQGREFPPSSDCGFLHNISFPFTVPQGPHCALFVIQNCDDPLKLKFIQLQNNGTKFWLTKFVPVRLTPATPTILNIRDQNLYELHESKSREAFSHNYTLHSTFPFGSISMQLSHTLFKCNRTLHVNPPPKHVNNYAKCPDYDLYYKSSTTLHDESLSSLTACTKVQLPVKDIADDNDPFTFVTSHVVIEVRLTDECADCYNVKGGKCQLDSRQRFICTFSYAKTRTTVLIAAAIVASLAGVAALMILAYYFGTKDFLTAYLRFREDNPSHGIIEKFLKEHGHLPTARYSYSEVRKMTNSFKNRLGQGGFGSVYKGRLQDGRAVAVKVLTESKGNGEEFINEVASISSTSHVNIVRLLGFCLNGAERALIYEYMPNGSLEKFIYEEKKPMKIHLQIDCKTLYNIAIGVARGLEYLHRGCNTKIVHFDIKPHNILLDEDFCPKISDFGLAKICTRRESVVSLLGARGTVGYIAPELFFRNYGPVSHKSDVYSYGMMILEIVGQRKNINVAVDSSSELYFPHWIYKRLESNQGLGLHHIKNDTDKEMVRKMIVVSLWCIQTNPSNRPTMSKVVEMLEGSLEVLQIPPISFLSYF